MGSVGFFVCWVNAAGTLIGKQNRLKSFAREIFLEKYRMQIQFWIGSRKDFEITHNACIFFSDLLKYMGNGNP